MARLSREAQNLNWLVGSFAQRVPGVAHAAVVSADGLLLAKSDHLDRGRADQLATVASGLSGLTEGASRCFNAGQVKQTIVEMQQGYLFVMSISDGSCLAVLSHADADAGVIGYEMTMLVTRTGEVLTPALRTELQAALPE
jgi:predicted regulator of Ras-like GTPase activity (Roadblock/LC7/MglB family)